MIRTSAAGAGAPAMTIGPRDAYHLPFSRENLAAVSPRSPYGASRLARSGKLRL